jgi:hypothetical protein
MAEKLDKWAPAGRCTLVAADVVGFGGQRRSRQIQTYLRDSLYKLFENALTDSGVDVTSCYSEDRGDGLVAVVPPEIPTDRLIHPFAEYLRAGLRLHNLVSSELAQLRLRVAVHGAQAWADTHGLVGDSVIHLFRLLDAPAFKQYVHQSGAYLALIASDAVYREVIMDAPGLIDPDDYDRVGIDHKELSTTGWVRLVGRASSVSQSA